MRKMLYDRSFELKAAYKRIEELAELDELTGSSNRRSIMRMLEEEMARSGRGGSPCSIALIDLDWFKRINDAYGHPTGDEVLRTFSITTYANIRSIDRFGRYGGEEFLLLLPYAVGTSPVSCLTRLRAAVAAQPFATAMGAVPVTFSAGVAQHRPDESNAALIDRADEALYRAKSAGRDRIETSD
jgi:diguanylate cyclase (GGDEF)-like protein